MNVGELRLLVVEDHGFQRWAVSNMLAGMGAKHVFAAADGHAALEAFHNVSPPLDVIITDLDMPDMPDMDGMELIRNLGAAGSHRPAPERARHRHGVRLGLARAPGAGVRSRCAARDGLSRQGVRAEGAQRSTPGRERMT